jgi:hypothetical protein
LKKKFSTFVLVAALAGAVAAMVTPVGCGPQQKFCPETSDGVCRPPVDTTGGTGGDNTGGGGTGGGAIFIDAGSFGSD